MQPLSEAMKTEASECAVKLLDAVPPATWFIRRQMRQHRKGLSILQFKALYFINANPYANLSMVAEHLGASLPSTSRLITGLESKDLIGRNGNKDDRRLVELAITASGTEVLDGAREATLTRIDQELVLLDDAQRRSLGYAMGLLRRVFDPALATRSKARATF